MRDYRFQNSLAVCLSVCVSQVTDDSDGPAVYTQCRGCSVGWGGGGRGRPKYSRSSESRVTLHADSRTRVRPHDSWVTVSLVINPTSNSTVLLSLRSLRGCFNNIQLLTFVIEVCYCFSTAMRCLSPLDINSRLIYLLSCLSLNILGLGLGPLLQKYRGIVFLRDCLDGSEILSKNILLI